jgi:hypothetical protein
VYIWPILVTIFILLNVKLWLVKFTIYNATVASTSQGFFNFLIYVRPRYIRMRRRNPEVGRWKTLVHVVRGESMTTTTTNDDGGSSLRFGALQRLRRGGGGNYHTTTATSDDANNSSPMPLSIFRILSSAFAIQHPRPNDDDNDGMDPTKRELSSKTKNSYRPTHHHHQQKVKSSTRSSTNDASLSADATNASEAKEEEQVMIPMTNDSNNSLVEDTSADSATRAVKFHEVVPMTISCSDALNSDEIAEPTV